MPADESFTWAKFKALVEERGVKDDDEIEWPDIYPVFLQLLCHPRYVRERRDARQV